MKIDTTGTSPSFDLHAPGMQLDEHQRAALAFDREILVSAGAGSGKTSTLSLRYTRLLVECAWQAALNDSMRCSIDSVLVLTFTDKAAQEMAERCERQFHRFVSAAQADREAILRHWGEARGAAFMRHLQSLLDQFANARISTFHSFYNSLLREHGLSLGIRPGFRVLTELETSDAIEQAVRTAYDEWRPTIPDAPYRDLALDLGGRQGIESATGILLRERTKFRDTPPEQASNGHLIAQLMGETALQGTALRDWIDSTALPFLEKFQKCIQPGNSEFYQKTLPALIADLKTPPKDPFEHHASVRNLFQTLFTTKAPRSLKGSTYLGLKNQWKDQDLLSEYKEAQNTLEDMKDALKTWAPMKKMVWMLPVAADVRADTGSAAVWGLYEIAKGHLETQLSEQQALDFSGIELHALALLNGNASVLQEIWQTHRFIMVDEFQDTNALQWDVLRIISRPPGENHDRLFAVGDLKQAIYSFRGGDVAVFSAARASIEHEIDLKYNYRSTPEIVGFNNALFEQVMGAHKENREAWEAHYTPVDAGRDWRVTGEIGAWSYTSSSAKDDASLEAEWIAWMCGELLDPDGPYAAHEFGDSQRHREAPIAILIRRRTHLEAYRAALSKAGIPNRVVKGVAFWRRTEILDLIHVMDASMNGEATSVVGFLRSPYACISDPLISDLASRRFGPCDLSNFVHGTLEPHAPEELVLAQKTLKALSTIGHNQSLRSLGEHALHFGAAAHAWEDQESYEAAQANVLKLLNLCTEYGHRGWSHGRILRSFIEQVEAQAREDEADFAGSGARVVLQTIHSAKGLQFPVVFLPALGSDRGRSRTLEVGRSPGGWSAAFKVLDPVDSKQTKVAPVRHFQITEQRKEEDAAESLRKLYVATTRAETHLYFVGDFSKPTANTWAELLQTSLTQDWGPVEMPDPPENALDVPGRSAAPRASEKPSAFEPISWSATLGLSPSSIRLYQACPMKWRLMQTYGSAQRIQDHRDHIKQAAGLRGDLLHALLDERRVDPAHGRQRWRSLARLHAWDDGISQQQEDRLVSDLQVLSESDELAFIFATESVTEPGFEVSFGDLRLQGRIDLIWRDSGEWVLTDFKSEKLNSPDQAWEEHRGQLTAYAWAASQLLSTPVFRTELFGTRTGARLPFPPLKEADFDDFEHLLRRIERDASEPVSAIQERIITDEIQRPCDTCDYLNTMCRGRSNP